MLTHRGMMVLGVAAGVLARRLPAVGSTVDAAGAASFPVALVAVLELALLAVCGWAVVALGVGSLGGGVGRTARRLLPRAVRAACVAGVAGTLVVAPAHADHDPLPASSVDGLVLPDRPVSDPEPAQAAHTQVRASTPAPPDPTPPEVAHVVEPGDSLWMLAARELGPGSRDADVARRTIQWHDANRDVIGPDPDLLQPGQRLDAPRAEA